MADAQLSSNDASMGQADDAFTQLVLEHQALDERIRALSALAYLTDQQHFEAAALKKRKLALKDRIEALRISQRQH